MKNNNWILPLGIALIVMIGFLGGLYIVGDVYKSSLYIVPSKNINLSFSFNDAFIGVMATLIGIMVTFVIGYQILNALQIKKDMDIYKDDMSMHKSEFESFLSQINNVKIIADIKESESNILINISLLDSLKAQYNNGNMGLVVLYSDYLVHLYKYFENLSSYISNVKVIDRKYLYEGFSSEVIKNALSEGELTEYEKKQGLPEHGNRNYVLLGAVASIKRDVDSDVLRKYLSDIEQMITIIVINNMLKNNN